MGSEWKTRDLKDCATWHSGGTPRKGIVEYWGGDIPWISAKSLKDFFVSDSEDKVTEEGSRNGTKLVPTDTILFVVRGMSLKSEFRIGITTRPVTFNQDLKALVANDENLPYFLAYAIRGRTAEILDLVGEAGHGTGVLPTDRIQAVQIPCLSLKEQQRIIDVLKTLDDKIELNRRMNATLEGMAQALFKSWFVDFDPVIDNALAAGNPIPDELAPRAEVRRQAWENGAPAPLRTKEKDEKEKDGAGAPSLPDLNHLFPAAFQETESMGWIPEGWEVGSFLDEAKLLSGGTPKTSEPEYWNGGVRWASAKDVSQCGKAFLIETEKTITDLGLNKSATKIIPKFSTVVVARGATTGRMTMFGEDIAMNQTCYGMRMKSGNHFYGYCHSKNLITNLVGAAHGSVFDTITTTTFESSKVLQAPQIFASLFEEEVATHFRKILSNQQQTSTLTKLRDTLLPKLISGELRIPEAEKITKQNLT